MIYDKRKLWEWCVMEIYEVIFTNNRPNQGILKDTVGSTAMVEG